MARVLLIGSGPLPRFSPDTLGFPQLRCAHFLEEIQKEHELGLILLQGDSESVPDLPHVCVLEPDAPDWVETAQAFVESFSPDVVVGGGPYHPARLAALVAGERPLWIDIAGDPFAEAQAKSAHTGESGHSREMYTAYIGALTRADAFSVVSHAQRHALQGQLGVLGRLEVAPLAQEWIHVVPVGYHFGDLREAEPKRSPEGELVVALCGGYNTWLDGENLLKGLLLAMRRAPGLRVLSTGGAIDGHHSATYDAFRAQALSSPFADRFTFHGWVSHRALPELLSRAHVGVCMDHPGAEPELGSRTRVLFYFHQGLEVLSTLGSEICTELASLRMLRGIEVGSPESLSDELVRMSRTELSGLAPQRAQQFMRGRYLPEQTLGPLMQWLDAPIRVDQVQDPAVQLAAELAKARSELKYVYATPTWRAAGAADRFIKLGTQRLDRIFGKD